MAKSTRATRTKRTKGASTRTKRSLPAPSGKPVIIVESPAKTRTLAKILGNAYAIEASMGHVRDLPKSKLGVDVENDFQPIYTPLPDRKETLERLKAVTQGAPAVYLATDPDREGEAIAWHIQQALGLQNAQRIEFNEITASAVQRALQSPRTIDLDRVNAQQARRVLDRLVGYQISPLLWRKLRGGRNALSAGRVQSVAVRLIVEREREIRAFVPEEYWKITATLTPKTEHFPFDAELRQKGDAKLELKTEADANAVLNDLQGATYIVESVEKRQRKRTPPPPFITSTSSRKPRANSASPPSARCKSRSNSTKASNSATRARSDSSPTCAPTRYASPTRRCRWRANSSKRTTRPTTCPASRANTKPNQARRTPTKPSVPPM
jgi:reverse gyrase